MKKSRRSIRIVLIVAGVLLVVFVVASFLIINHFMKEYFNRSEQKKYSEYMRWADFEDFPRETVTFASGNETLTGYTYSKAIGIKTGYTGEAGRCLASAAMDELGRTFYCVVLGTEDEEGTGHKFSFSESKRLLEWAFDNFHRTILLNQDTENVMREVEVTLSDEADYVQAMPVGEIEATMPSDYDPKRAELLVELPDSIEAPVTAGDKLGTVTFKYDGVTYGTLDMVAMDSVARSDFLYTIQQIQIYWAKWWVKALAAVAVVLILLLIFFLVVVRPKRKARRRYNRSGGRKVGAGSYRGRR